MAWVFAVDIPDGRNTEHVSPRAEKATMRAGTWDDDLSSRRDVEAQPPNAVLRVPPALGNMRGASYPPYPDSTMSASVVSVHSSPIASPRPACACRGQDRLPKDPERLDSWQPWPGVMLECWMRRFVCAKPEAVVACPCRCANDGHVGDGKGVWVGQGDWCNASFVEKASKMQVSGRILGAHRCVKHVESRSADLLDANP